MAPNLKNIRFGRRKSQGNSIDAGDSSSTGPVSSFRVIPREDTPRKSTGNALDLRKAATFQPTRQSSYEYDSGSSNRYAVSHKMWVEGKSSNLAAIVLDRTAQEEDLLSL
jgi:hypothetical protein